jgi:hypothetical protein
VDVVGVAGGSLLVIMFEAPYSLHTHSRSSSYIYNAIQHLLPSKECNPSLIYYAWSHRGVVAVGDSLCFSFESCCMFRAPHPLHTHDINSTLHKYYVFQHLLCGFHSSQTDMLGFMSQWQSLESLLVSHLQCAVGYDLGNPPTSYS